jgi:hypothetical protein
LAQAQAAQVVREFLHPLLVQQLQELAVAADQDRLEMVVLAVADKEVLADQHLVQEQPIQVLAVAAEAQTQITVVLAVLA